MLKRKIIVEVMGRGEIYLFKETIDLGYLEGIIEANEKAVEYLTKLKTIIDKLKVLGIESKVEVEVSDWRENYVDITSSECDNILKVYITIPAKKKEWEIFREIRNYNSKEFNEQIFKKLVELAITEKQKAINLLEKLEKEGLIVYVEERDTDC